MVITRDILLAADNDSSPDEIVFLIVQPMSNIGQFVLQPTGSVIARPVANFTQADINNMAVVFNHRGNGVSVGPHGVSVGPHGASVGPHGVSVGPHGASVGPHGVSVGPHGASVGPHGVSVGPHGVSVGPHDVSVGPHGVSVGPHGVSVGLQIRDIYGAI